MTTLRKLGTSTLRLLNVVQAGQAPNDDDLRIAVQSLGVLIDSWSNDRLAVHKMLPLYFALVAGQKEYTMGPGGDWNVTRPMRIEQAYLSYGASLVNGTITLTRTTNDIPIDILTAHEYADVAMKNMPLSIQTAMYDNGDYPLRKLSFYPVPSTNAVVTLWMWQPLINIDDLDGEITFPPGYERALKFNLAVELAAEFGKSLTQEIVDSAQDSWSKLRRLNSRPGFIENRRV